MPLFVGFVPHARPKLPLLTNPGSLRNGVPSTEELAALQNELQDIRSRTARLIRKAEDDLELFQSKWEVAKERERPSKEDRHSREKQNKSRTKESLQRVKREISETPSTDDFAFHDAARHRSASHNIRKSDERRKKRKRDQTKESMEGDTEIHDGTIHLSPLEAPVTYERPLKKAKYVAQTAQLTIPPPQPPAPFDPDVATDFSLPNPVISTNRPILGLWGEGGILKPTAPHAYEVHDDFTSSKAPPNQTQTHVFWKEVESWMKAVGEEDVEWLRYSTDDIDLFRVPKLGRHYSEVWEEQDQELASIHYEMAQGDPSYGINTIPSAHTNGHLPHASGSPAKPGATSSQQNSHDAVTDADLVMQKKTLGPFTERVLSALLSEAGRPAAIPPPPPEEELGATPGITNVTVVTPTPVSFNDLETRLRLELKACGLLGVEEPDFSESQDDSIASTLRSLQGRLRGVKHMNEAHKDRLSNIARHRLAYADYSEMLEDMNRQINAGYARIVRANAAIGRKKKKPGSEKDAASAEAAAEAARLKTLVLDVPESLLRLVEIRRQLKESFGQAIISQEKREPGRFMAFPRQSIYAGLQITPDDWEDDGPKGDSRPDEEMAVA